MFLLHGVNEGLERSHKKRDHIQKPWRRFGGKHREAGSEGTSPRVCIMNRPGGLDEIWCAGPNRTVGRLPSGTDRPNW